MTSNIAITDKNDEKKKCQTTAKYNSITGTQGAFLDNVTPCTDGFTDEPDVHQRDVQVVENTFVDDSK